MEEIDILREAEEHNYNIARTQLCDEVTLIDDLARIYQLFCNKIGESKVSGKRELEITSLVQFLLACRYQLVVSSLILLRGHINDAYLFTRRAIENCAFAARVKKHPHLAEIWLKAGDTPESYAIYRSKFSSGKIFPADQNFLGELYNRYDLCSRFSHPSLYAFAGHLNVGIDSDKIDVRFDYFQLVNGKPDEPIRSLLWTIDTHYGILRLFVELFSDVEGFNKKAINDQLLIFQGELDRNKEKWKSVLLTKF